MSEQFVFPLLVCLLLVTLIGRFWGWAALGFQLFQGVMVFAIAAAVAWAVFGHLPGASFTLNEVVVIFVIELAVFGMEVSIMLANWLYPGMFGKH